MKLIVLDLEGTIFKTKVRLPGTNLDSTIWQGLANALGNDAINEEVQTHKKWEENKYNNYLEWMKDTIDIHVKYGLKESLFNNVINSAEYTDKADVFFNGIDRSKYIIAIVSGGFSSLAKRVSIDYNVFNYFTACDYYFVNDDLKGYNLLPCDFNGKIKFIDTLLDEYQIKDWIFVGDGGNDVPIAQKAPFSFGINPHLDLAKVVDVKINSLDEILNYL